MLNFEFTDFALCPFVPLFLQQLYPYSPCVFQHLLDFCGQVNLPARALYASLCQPPLPRIMQMRFDVLSSNR